MIIISSVVKGKKRSRNSVKQKKFVRPNHKLIRSSSDSLRKRARNSKQILLQKKLKKSMDETKR